MDSFVCHKRQGGPVYDDDGGDEGDEGDAVDGGLSVYDDDGVRTLFIDNEDQADSINNDNELEEGANMHTPLGDVGGVMVDDNDIAS